MLIKYIVLYLSIIAMKQLYKQNKMTKIKFTLKQLKIIDSAMEVIEYSGIKLSSDKYKIALQIKNKIRKQYHKQNN